MKKLIFIIICCLSCIAAIGAGMAIRYFVERYENSIETVIEGSAVYVIGWEIDAQGNTVPMLWKNGIAQIASGSNDTDVRTVFLYDNCIYVDRLEDNDGVNMLLEMWKKGVIIIEYFKLRMFYDLCFKDVKENGKITENTNELRALQNEVRQELKRNSNASFDISLLTPEKFNVEAALLLEDFIYSMNEHYFSHFQYLSNRYVSGNDVYVVSGETLLKNGVEQIFPDGNNFTLAHAVYVSGDDIYT